MIYSGIKMITVYVCVGSSCYLKGGGEIADKYSLLIKESSLEDRVQLKGAFCLKNCSSGVAVMIEEEIITEVTRENCEQIFRDKVLRRLE
ncbi:MAG: hypothetical protein DDT30_01445 [Dehalococcoidia bacterium]|nr:hypothetical protein [Bacillota bacterium]